MHAVPIVLVHGAWHGGWAWDPLAEQLSATGRHVVAVDLPSSGPDPTTLGDLHADADVVGAALDALGAPAVLAGHSYGGQVISQASAGRDDVSHLVYVCAFMLDVGESLFGSIDGEGPDWVEVVADGTALRAHRPNEIFYGDVSAGLAAASADRLQLQSIASFAAGLTGAGWHDVPSTYIVCEHDRAVPVPLQDSMSARAGTVHRMMSSHSPFLSMPAEVAAIILDV